MNFLKSFLVVALLLNFGCNKDTGDKVEEAANTVSENVEGMANKVEREACEMVDGKLECAAEEVKENVKAAADELTN
jgi:hypothetical protein